MKPLRLALQAFGPFWNRAEIDFHPTLPQGLFLIHGPVGSGKTTLLDGICFSLYGVSSGGERLAQQLRSDLAPDSTPTIVEFDFEAAGKTWKIVRTLDSLRLNGESVGDAQIEKILGLNPFQFRRSVMLPQGQFQQFLLAPAGEREQILAALFHTHSPRLYQAALARACEETENELRRAWRRREETNAHELLRQARHRQLDLQGQLQRWKEQRQSFQQNRERAVLVEERSRERQRVQQELRQLEQREMELARLRQRQEKLQRALKLAPQVQQWEQAKIDEETARENYQKAQEELDSRLQALAPAREMSDQLDALRQQRQHLQAQLQQLDRHEAELNRLRQAEERLTRCRGTWNQLEEEGLTMKRELESGQGRLQETQRIGAQEEELRREVLRQQKQLEVLREGFKRQKTREELQQGLQRVQANLVKIAERRDRVLGQIDKLESTLAERTRQLELHWSHSLAQQLKPGQACPVCGSIEHPQPNATPGSPVQVSLEQLRKQVDLAWKQAEKIEEEEREQQITLARLEERLQATPEPGEMDTTQVAVIRDSLRELERELQRLHHFRDHEERDERRVRKLQKRLERWQEARSVAQNALTSADAIVSERRSQIPAELLTQGEVTRQRKQLQAQLEPLQRRLEAQQLQMGQDTHLHASFQAAALAARKSVELSRERTRLAWEVLSTKLELSHFEGLADWQQHHQQAQSELESLQQQLQGHQSLKEQLEKEAERAEARYHESLEDWSELEIAPDQLEQRLQETYAEVAQSEEEIRQLERQVAEYDRAVLEIQQLEPRLAQLRRLTQVALGDNAMQLTFQQWVLAQQMECVLQSANHRLMQMTRGRYTLESAGTSLDLQVLDHLSGQSRSVTTLSGGESFLASLALAIGLSDSFQEAGNNAVLDTLFIDEGFGSLDEEGLDQAFWALEPIERSGRIIGVVSHLAEVRQRIRRRLEIRPGPSGNQLVWNRD